MADGDDATGARRGRAHGSSPGDAPQPAIESTVPASTAPASTVTVVDPTDTARAGRLLDAGASVLVGVDTEPSVQAAAAEMVAELAAGNLQ